VDVVAEAIDLLSDHPVAPLLDRVRRSSRGEAAVTPLIANIAKIANIANIVKSGHVRQLC
jgi:hypothetical protein